MAERRVNEALYEQFARVGKVTGHPKRLELLDLSCQSERSVEELARLTDLKLTTAASGQLQRLREARLVTTRCEGKQMYDRVSVDLEIVAYGRGPFCVLAPAAVAQLRQAGRRARRLDAGLPEWRLAGLLTDVRAS